MPADNDTQHNDLFGVHIPSDESDEPSYDILKAYPRIGASVAPNGSPSKPAARQPLGRSSTTRF
jgi:hypothetical protein